MRKPNRRRFRNTRRRGDFSYTIPARNLLRGMGISVTPMDEEYDPNLKRGVEENDVEFVKEYLRSGECSNIDGVLGGGETALMLAAEMDNAVMCKVLIDAGANIEARNDNKDTALTLSAMLGKNKALRVLIEEGADVDKQGYDGYTALAQCAENGNLEGAKMLVEAGARTDTKTLGMTPLELAEMEGHTKVASYLRRVEGQTGRRGRNFSSYTDEEGDTLEDKLNIIRRVIWTGEKKNIDDYELLDLFRDRDLRKVSRATEAACNHLIEVISYLRGDTDERPLSLAVYRDAEIIHGSMDQYVRNLTRGILRDSVKVEKKFNRELTRQLTAEVSKKNPSIPEIKRLIAEGAEVNVAGKDGLTLLMFACEGSKWDVVKVLLDAGAGSRTQDVDDYGNTAMMYAVFDDKADMIAPLVRSGVDPSQETNSGESPLSLATREASFATFNALLQNGADPSTTNSVGFSALMNAVNRDDIRFVKALVEAGADVNAVALFGQSALGIAECRANELWNNKPAMKAKCLEIADYLRSVGAKSAGDVDVGYLD